MRRLAAIAWLCLLVAVRDGAAESWRSVAIDGGGPTNVVACSPHEPGRLLAGGEAAGLHLSLDGGRSWQLCAGLGSEAEHAVAAVTFHPTRPELAYAAAGLASEPRPGDLGLLLASADGGRTWAVRSRQVRFSGAGSWRQGPGVLQVDPFQPDWIWAATAWDGVRVSPDSGRTWRPIGLAGRFLTDLARTADGSLFAVIRSSGQDPGGVALLRAGGQGDWVPIYTGPALAAAAAPSEPGRLLLATPDAGLLLTRDFGANWTNVTPAGLAERLRLTAVAFAPSHPAIAVLAGEPRLGGPRHPCLYLSRDGGLTWDPMTGDEPGQLALGVWWGGPEQFGLGVRQVAFDPTTADRLWLADQTTIWGSHDGAASWFSGHQGLRTAAVTAWAPDPVDSRRAWFGTSLAGAFAALDGGLAVPLGGNGTLVREVPALAGRRGQQGGEVLLARGRELWRQVVQGHWSAVGEPAPAPLRALDWLPDGRLLAWCDGLGWQTADGLGRHWQSWGSLPRLDGLPVEPTSLPLRLDAIGRAAVLLDRDGRIWLTRDAGTTWGRIDEGLPRTRLSDRRPTPQAAAVAVAAVPGGSPRLYAAVPTGLWRTDDLGGEWHRVFDGLVGVAAAAGQRVVVATRPTWQSGEPCRLWQSLDAGGHWAPATRLPVTARVTGLWLDPSDAERLWVGTAGQGAWVGRWPGQPGQAHRDVMLTPGSVALTDYTRGSAARWRGEGVCR